MIKGTNKIEGLIEPHLLRCRPGDWNHAKRVASWVKKIGNEQENFYLILVSAYIHDIGWRDLVDQEHITLDQLLELEPQANSNSEPFIQEVLHGYYTKEELRTILRLVRAADRHESQEKDEAIIVDADGLSKLTIDHLKEKFEESEWMNLFDLWKEMLPQRIQTEKAKELYPDLLNKLEEDIKKSLSSF